jgi:hypothetical protein
MRYYSHNRAINSTKHKQTETSTKHKTDTDENLKANHVLDII